MSAVAKKRILLIVGGGIAAYKSLDLIRRLRERGADVRCILTDGAQRFVTPLAAAALSGQKAHTDLFDRDDERATDRGFALHPESVPAIGRAEGRGNAWGTVALWVIAILLLLVLLRAF